MSRPKDAKTYQEQLDLLKSRGLVVADESFALHTLEHHNYYRLSPYRFPFTQPGNRDAFQSGTTHLAPDNIEKGNGVLLPCRTVREDKVISSNHRFYPGQIVYSKIRPNLAKVVVVDFEGLCSADMYPIDALIDSFYLQRYMLSESFLVQAVKTDTRVAMPKINQMELNAIAVPIPPLAEQRQIVAKVEQLMALVDALETQLAASRATAANLLSAVVSELIASKR